MSTLAYSWEQFRKPVQWMLVGGAAALILSALAVPNLMRSRGPAEQSAFLAKQHSVASDAEQSFGAVTSPRSPVAASLLLDDKVPLAEGSPAPDAIAGRKIIRTVAVDMLVRNPAEVADSITKMAEILGGYLVSAEIRQSSAVATLTIRVPAARLEQARSQIRSVGLKVESEKVDAQDVTRQYIDQDATLRNLRAEEAQFLTILKQAHSVKDMLSVSEKLSDVRGQIEQWQAEFNALSQQIETVAITVSLRSEAEVQVLGLNWQPLYQLKLAVRDGLDSLATYATAMITILFDLPAILLWIGTICLVGIGGWRALRWTGRRWLGWKTVEVMEQK